MVQSLTSTATALLICTYCITLTSTAHSDTLFAAVDSNNDNKVSTDELQHYIRANIGGNEFDATHEINDAAAEVFDNVLQPHNIHRSIDPHAGHAAGTDGQTELSSADFELYWAKLGQLLTVNEVADYISYAVQLPQLSQKFVDNAITGYDFNYLIDNDGAALLHDLHIESQLHRKQLVRAMKMKLLAVVDEPSQVQSIDVVAFDCDELVLAWVPAKSTAVPINKYRVQRRRRLTNTTDTAADKQWTEWRTLGTVTDTQYLDGDLKPHTTYAYRIDAWNIVGHSIWSDTVVHTTGEPCRQHVPLHLNDAEIQHNISHKLAAYEAAQHGGLLSRVLSWLSGVAQMVVVSVATSASVMYGYRYLQQQRRKQQRPVVKSTSNNSVKPLKRGSSRQLLNIPEVEKKDAMTSPMAREHSSVQSFSNNISSSGIPPTSLPRSSSRPAMPIIESHDNIDTLSPPEHTRSSSHNGSVRAAIAAIQLRHRAQQAKLDRERSEMVLDDPTPEASSNTSSSLNSSSHQRESLDRAGSASDVLVHSKSSSPLLTNSGQKPAQPLSTSRSTDFTVPPALDISQLDRQASYDDLSPSSRLKYCCVCFKKYKSLLSAYKRHYCSNCHMPFCAEHGVVKHMNMTPCGVPGNCLCNNCAKVLAKQAAEKLALKAAKKAQMRLAMQQRQQSHPQS